jgi:preprotein translocase subunit SecB
MQLSPLQLLEYSFDGVSITPVDGFDNSKRDPLLVFAPNDMKLQSEVGLAVLQEHKDLSDYGLRLILALGPKETVATPYEVRVSVVGSVRMQGGGTPEQRQKLALVNGISLLCGVVRDLVASVTSRSRYGQMLLPTLNFAKLADQPISSEVIESPVKKTKAGSAKLRTTSSRRKG